MGARNFLAAVYFIMTILNLFFSQNLLLTSLLIIMFSWLLSRGNWLYFYLLLPLIGLSLATWNIFPVVIKLVQDNEFITGFIVNKLFLPTLLFTAAFGLETQHLRRYLVPILSIGLVGMGLSAGILQYGVSAFWQMFNPMAILILALVLSISDSAIALKTLRQVSFSPRFQHLLAGESLLHSAFAIVAINVLFQYGIHAPLNELSSELAWQIAGGIIGGWGLASLAAIFSKQLPQHPFFSISLILLLLYGSAWFAEAIQLSSSFAVISVGLHLSTWEHNRLDPATKRYIRLQLRYISQVMSALLFLVAGLQADILFIIELLPVSLGILVTGWILRALLLSVLLPLLQALPPYVRYAPQYRPVLIWSGIHGVMPLAIVSSFAELSYFPQLLAISLTVSYLSLLIQGVSLPALLAWQKFNQPSLIDKMAILESQLTAKQQVLQAIPQLQQGGLFSTRIAERQRQRCENALRIQQAELAELWQSVPSSETAQCLLFIQTFATEKAFYHDMFLYGQLSEAAYRNLSYSVALQIDGLQHEGKLPRVTLHSPEYERFQQQCLNLLQPIPLIKQGVAIWRKRETAREYEEAWGRHQGNLRVMARLEEIAAVNVARPEVVEKVRSNYRRWQDSARARLDSTTEQFAEFVSAMQEQVAARLVLHAEYEAISAQVQRGILSPTLAHPLLKTLQQQLQSTQQSIVPPHLSVLDLLQNLQGFKQLSRETCAQITQQLCCRELRSGQYLCAQGDLTHSLYLVTRGVIRISRAQLDYGTLMAGDYFGEEALLQPCVCPVSYRAVTAVTVYELQGAVFSQLLQEYPALRVWQHGVRVA
jgi:NhaP-type Na+/H+ or K+/H+ antiporter